MSIRLSWHGLAAASRLRQWPAIVDLAERVDAAWARRHELHPSEATCWDYPRPEGRDVAAHRSLTDELVLFDGLVATSSGARVADPLVVLVGETRLADRLARFDPTSERPGEIELHEVERLYGRLKVATRATRGR